MADKLIGFIEGDTACEFCGETLVNGPDWLSTNFDIIHTPPPETTPSATAGDSFEFQGGTIASLFNGEYFDDDYDGNTGTILKEGNPTTSAKNPAPMIALFDYFRFRDGDGDDTIWSATIPVYKDSFVAPDCMNPNTSLEILGFAKIQVIQPVSAPANNIQVLVDCNLSLIEGRGGGGGFGNILGTIPNLVK